MRLDVLLGLALCVSLTVGDTLVIRESASGSSYNGVPSHSSRRTTFTSKTSGSPGIGVRSGFGTGTRSSFGSGGGYSSGGANIAAAVQDLTNQVFNSAGIGTRYGGGGYNRRPSFNTYNTNTRPSYNNRRTYNNNRRTYNNRPTYNSRPAYNSGGYGSSFGNTHATSNQYVPSIPNIRIPNIHIPSVGGYGSGGTATGNADANIVSAVGGGSSIQTLSASAGGSASNGGSSYNSASGQLTSVNTGYGDSITSSNVQTNSNQYGGGNNRRKW